MFKEEELVDELTNKVRKLDLRALLPSLKYVYVDEQSPLVVNVNRNK